MKFKRCYSNIIFDALLNIVRTALIMTQNKKSDLKILTLTPKTYMLIITPKIRP